MEVDKFVNTFVPNQDKKTEMKTFTMTFNTKKTEFLSLFLIKRRPQPNTSSLGAFLFHLPLLLLILVKMMLS